MTKKAVKKSATKPYSVVARILGREYKGSGETIRDAIASVDAPNAKGNCIMTISHGDKTQERVFNKQVTAKLFTLSPLMREIALKQAALRFDL